MHKISEVKFHFDHLHRIGDLISIRFFI